MRLAAEALAVSAELLRCAAPAPRLRGARHMLKAMRTGDLRLVGLVLEAFPDSLLRPNPEDSAECLSAVGVACNTLYGELPYSDYDLQPAEVSWNLQVGDHLHCGTLVAHYAAAYEPVHPLVIGT